MLKQFLRDKNNKKGNWIFSHNLGLFISITWAAHLFQRSPCIDTHSKTQPKTYSFHFPYFPKMIYAIWTEVCKIWVLKMMLNYLFGDLRRSSPSPNQAILVFLSCGDLRKVWLQERWNRALPPPPSFFSSLFWTLP